MWPQDEDHHEEVNAGKDVRGGATTTTTTIAAAAYSHAMPVWVVRRSYTGGCGELRACDVESSYCFVHESIVRTFDTPLLCGNK